MQKELITVLQGGDPPRPEAGESCPISERKKERLSLMANEPIHPIPWPTGSPLTQPTVVLVASESTHGSRPKTSLPPSAPMGTVAPGLLRSTGAHLRQVGRRVVGHDGAPALSARTRYDRDLRLHIRPR